jgi:transmembrane sensor
MKNTNARDILANYLSGGATEEEKTLVEGWILKEPKDTNELSDAQLLADLYDIRRRVFPREASFKKVQLWPRIAAAASVLLVLSISGYFLLHKQIKVENRIDHLAAAILPGKNGAILTLANGQKISLEQTKNGLIVQQNGTKLKKPNDSSLVYTSNAGNNSNEAAYNVLETPKGRQYSVVLPDGTRIWLNAASSIKYPTVFAGLKERKVFLTGEAYFEVAKDKNHPFKVVSGKQEVRVLGTHFNVNSYNDEPSIATTLFEGSVKINNQTMLKPGQQANLYSSGKVTLSSGSDNAIAWKDGKFRFEDTGIEEILRQLARWYNVDVVYPNGIPHETFSGYIDRGLNLSDALEILKYTRLNFKVEGRQIYVFK